MGLGLPQSMKSWASEIKSYEDVPRAFKDQFSTFSTNETIFPYTVFAPPYKSMQNKTPGKMLYFLNDRVVFMEKIKTDIISMVYYYKDIYYFTMGRELLYSWLKVEGISNGRAASSMIEYDSVVNDIFLPVMGIIRESTNDFGETDLPSERSKFDFLSSINYKFMNYSKGSIRHGERVIQTVLQNRVRVVFADLYIKKFYKTLTNAHMSILTDKELILIKETNHRGSNYGHTWTYIPLHRIEDLSIIMNDKDQTLFLRVQLKDNVKIDTIYDPSNKPELEALLVNFSSMR